MNLHIEERPGGDTAFYIDGDLQFDSADEALYHEGLALPPLVLARPPAAAAGLRVLICGGGDGLALRECLRFPGVASVDIVDYSPEVVDLGRTAFAALNANAFADSRARVHIADAWEFLAESAPGAFDVVLCDFTVPRQAEDARVYTREWYARVRHALSEEGVAGLNAVSPQHSPEAFWCLRRTVRAAGLNALPLRVCIPSFRDQGYGAWGFLLAAKRRLRRADLDALAACPVPSRALDLARLSEVSKFTFAERRTEGLVPVHSLDRPCLMPLLLNPGDRRRADPEQQETASLPSLEALLRAIPVLHPYHTRIMVESLAEDVVGSVRSLDLRRLLDALLAQGRALGAELRRELASLRSFLDLGELPRIELWGDWARRLFVALVLLLTIANIAGPDNVYGKGAEGVGHASVSRGYSEGGGFGRSEGGGSFRSEGPSGYRAGSRGSSGHEGAEGRGPGSFSRRGSFGSSGFHSDSAMPDAPLSGRGFRGGWQRGEAADIFGNSYHPRTFRYRVAPTHIGYGQVYYGGYGGSSSGQAAEQPAPQEQRGRFVADDDMLVLDNGDVAVTLSDGAYLLVTGGKVYLMSQSLPDPQMALFPDPRLLANIASRLRDQRMAVTHEIGVRRDWLTWVGWTDRLFPAVRADEAEVRALEDLGRRLDAAMAKVPMPSDSATLPPDLPPSVGSAVGATELFSGCGLLADGRIALVDDSGTYRFIWNRQFLVGDLAAPCPPGLLAALGSILPKLEREMAADQRENDNDQSSLASDRASLQKDLSDYTRLYNQNGPSSDVDYGTDEITAADALERTRRDLTQNDSDQRAAQAQQTTLTAQIDRLRAAEAMFK